MNIAYRDKNGLIVAVYSNCDSETYKNENYTREEWFDTPIEIDDTLKAVAQPRETLEDKIKRIVLELK
jgi:hypothetical protein